MSLNAWSPHLSCKHENSFFTVTPFASCISIRYAFPGLFPESLKFTALYFGIFRLQLHSAVARACDRLALRMFHPLFQAALKLLVYSEPPTDRYQIGFMEVTSSTLNWLVAWAGFEPAHTRVKVWCLTAWRPRIIYKARLRFTLNIASFVFLCIPIRTVLTPEPILSTYSSTCLVYIYYPFILLLSIL